MPVAQPQPRVVEIPYVPRPEFLPYHNRTQRFAKLVCHRRFGKTVACINDLIRRALMNTRKEPQPRYAYIGPTFVQVKDVAWAYCKYYTALLPGLQVSDGELWIKLTNGAQLRLYGADNYDRMRGVYNDGVVIDEPAQQDPRAWPEVIRPTLSDFSGWATFIGTPAGRNWFYQLGRVSDGSDLDPSWFHLVLPASATLDTMHAHKITAGEAASVWDDELESARSTMTPEQYAQEYECSFEAAIIGAYYGKLMAAAEEDKRITGVPYDPGARVYTAWDLGMADETSIWFAQMVGREVHLIDYYENSGVDLGHYVRLILSKPYVYAGHIVPFDSQARELGTGKSRLEVLEKLGLKPLEVCPNQRVEDGINAVRQFLPRCWFDKKRCTRGVDALKLYRSQYDDKLQTLRQNPVHDWASHPADAFRYLALTLDTKLILTGFNRRIDMPRLGVA
jgi:phage terminase large subunit